MERQAEGERLKALEERRAEGGGQGREEGWKAGGKNRTGETAPVHQDACCEGGNRSNGEKGRTISSVDCEFVFT
jgi:hypothetical protein